MNELDKYAKKGMALVILAGAGLVVMWLLAILANIAHAPYMSPYGIGWTLAATAWCGGAVLWAINHSRWARARKQLVDSRKREQK